MACAGAAQIREIEIVGVFQVVGGVVDVFGRAAELVVVVVAVSRVRRFAQNAAGVVLRTCPGVAAGQMIKEERREGGLRSRRRLSHIRPRRCLAGRPRC